MLSNFNKFANSKNTLSVILLYTKYILYTVDLLNTKRHRMTKKKIDKIFGKGHCLFFSTTISGIGNKKVLAHPFKNYFRWWKIDCLFSLHKHYQNYLSKLADWKNTDKHCLTSYTTWIWRMISNGPHEV